MIYDDITGVPYGVPAVRVITRVVYYFTLSSIQYVEVKFKRNSVRSQRTEVCS